MWMKNVSRIQTHSHVCYTKTWCGWRMSHEYRHTLMSAILKHNVDEDGQIQTHSHVCYTKTWCGWRMSHECRHTLMSAILKHDVDEEHLTNTDTLSLCCTKVWKESCRGRMPDKINIVMLSSCRGRMPDKINIVMLSACHTYYSLYHIQWLHSLHSIH